MAEHLQKGKIAEQEAAKFLIQKGFEIVAQNYRFEKAEIDIIAQKTDLLIFVEVKFRTKTNFGQPESFVDAKKQDLILLAAEQYQIENQINIPIRFDVISVKPNKQSLEIEHFEDAFY